jgi:hypothetical protein
MAPSHFKQTSAIHTVKIVEGSAKLLSTNTKLGGHDFNAHGYEYNRVVVRGASGVSCRRPCPLSDGLDDSRLCFFVVADLVGCWLPLRCLGLLTMCAFATWLQDGRGIFHIVAGSKPRSWSSHNYEVIFHAPIVAT